MNARWLLTKWKGFTLGRDYLQAHDRYYAAILFNALQEMSEKEVSFLHARYFDTEHGVHHEIANNIYLSYQPNSDKAMAEKLGIEIKEYTKQRVAIEKKFMYQVRKAQLKVDEKQIEKEAYFVLRLGNLYLKEYRIISNYFREVSPDMVLTQDGEKAIQFEKGDSLADDLIRVAGFKKEKIKTIYNYHKIYNL